MSTRPVNSASWPQDQRRRTFPSARAYLLMALAFVTFAVYASLLPFDLQWQSPLAAWTQFFAALRAMPSDISQADVLANALLFVPVGFCLAGSLLVDRRSLMRVFAVVVPVLLFSAVISLATEYLQMFAPRRVPSVVDVAAQTVGSAIGVAVWLIAGNAITAWLRNLATARHDRLSRLLAAYVVCWILFSLAPFDVTVDVGELAARWRSGDIAVIPFTGSSQPLARRIWDALAEVTTAVPLGVLGVIGWVGGGRRRSAAAGFAVGALLVALAELAQVFIRSHAAQTTDVLFGMCGAALGAWLVTRRSSVISVGQAEAYTRSGAAAAGLVAVFVTVAYYHWQPFDFSVDEERIRQKLAALSLLPFAAYGAGSYLNSLSDLLTKLAVSLPLGACVVFVARGPRGAAAVAWLCGIAAFLAAIEVGQFFLPTRFPDATDVLIGLTGAAVGLLAARWLYDSRR